MLSASSVTRTRQIHPVTSCCLYKHLNEALKITPLREMRAVFSKKTGWKNVKRRVHSFSFGIWSCIWSWPYFRWFVFFERQTFCFTDSLYKSWYHHETMMPTTMLITRDGFQSTWKIWFVWRKCTLEWQLNSEAENLWFTNQVVHSLFWQ